MQGPQGPQGPQGVAGPQGPQGIQGPLSTNDYAIAESNTPQSVVSGGLIEISNQSYLSTASFADTSPTVITILASGTYRIDYKIMAEGQRDAAIYLNGVLLSTSHHFNALSGALIGTAIAVIPAGQTPSALTLRNTSALPMNIPIYAGSIIPGTPSNVYVVITKYA